MKNLAKILLAFFIISIPLSAFADAERAERQESVLDVSKTDIKESPQGYTTSAQDGKDEIQAKLRGTSIRGTIETKNSRVKGRIRNESRTEKAQNVAEGVGSKAVMGAVSLQNTKMDGTIGNAAKVKDTINSSPGINSEAYMGSVSSE